jgi:hypothetical protein
MRNDKDFFHLREGGGSRRTWRVVEGLPPNRTKLNPQGTFIKGTRCIEEVHAVTVTLGLGEFGQKEELTAANDVAGGGDTASVRKPVRAQVKV